MASARASTMAVSSVVSATRASPSLAEVIASSASAVMSLARSSTPRRTSTSRSSADSGYSRHRVERLISAALTSKYGFSVVAPMRTT